MQKQSPEPTTDSDLHELWYPFSGHDHQIDEVITIRLAKCEVKSKDRLSPTLIVTIEDIRDPGNTPMFLLTVQCKRYVHSMNADEFYTSYMVTDGSVWHPLIRGSAKFFSLPFSLGCPNRTYSTTDQKKIVAKIKEFVKDL